MLIKLIICAIVALVIGLIVGRYLVNNHHVATNFMDGEIILDKNEDGNDRIFFNLGMEYDDIKNFDYITFKVTKK